jgi:hypothetical protein
MLPPPWILYITLRLGPSAWTTTCTAAGIHVCPGYLQRVGPAAELGWAGPAITALVVLTCPAPESPLIRFAWYP